MWGRQERQMIRQTNPVGMLINPGIWSDLIWNALKKNDASYSRRGRFMSNMQRGPDGLAASGRVILRGGVAGQLLMVRWIYSSLPRLMKQAGMLVACNCWSSIHRLGQ